MIFRSMDQVEEELRRRIRQHLRSGEIGSNMSRAKMKARADELSQFLGWLRGKERGPE